ncbi:hypothetical protein KIN20_005563 [Parelaphostrongylus tenuis]|uniref:Uncharacterized protein n=1 Tax=Parelaphostrongylus tenuis TaxID=148309 RepID=A0AAD5QF95_PARTN|nr:hypothetical protein KIN20_005563 [Parelaphostrongylus tenuis]
MGCGTSTHAQTVVPTIEVIEPPPTPLPAENDCKAQAANSDDGGNVTAASQKDQLSGEYTITRLLLLDEDCSALVLYAS